MASKMPEGTDQIVDPNVSEIMEETSIPMDNDAEALGMGAAGSELDEEDGDEAGPPQSSGGSSGAGGGADPAASFRDAAGQAKEKAADLKGQAAEKLRAFVDTGRGQVTGSINNFAKLVEDSAQTVDEKVGSQYGDYARQAAQMLSGVATKIDEQDIDALLDTARDTVRKSPALAIGAAAAIGFVLARVVKSGIDAASAAVDSATSTSSDDKKA